MQPLTNEQKQLLFDYSLDLTTEEETAQAEALISSSNEAADIHSKIKSVLAPLDTVRDDPCPDDLAERTIWRLRAAPAPVATTRRPWRNFAQVGAIAATIFIAVGVLVPSFSFARHQYRKHVCQNQLTGIGSCISSYCADYDGKLPAASTDVSQPWHRIGDQGRENRSNTRNPFLLLKLGYHTRPQDFVCCGRRQKRISPLKASEASNYNDFLSGEHISYSFRIFCRPSITISLLGGQPLMADRNPVFEHVPEERFDVHLDEGLCSRHSINHRRGQNILFIDGHARFLKTRNVGIPQDDIYTVQNISAYRGNERPACEQDCFLGP